MNVGFIIGCSRYDDHDIANLSFAHRDASRFADVLRSTWGFDDEEIMSFHDGHPDPRFTPTRANILRQISRGSRLAGGVTIDLMVFFFSGHGFRSTLTNADYLLTQDSWVTALEDTALQFDNIVRRLQEWEPRHVVLFIDACRSSVAGGKASAAEQLPSVDVASLCPPGMVSFCSCEPNRSSYECDELQSGIFTAGVCEAFSDDGRCRTIYELDDYLTRTIPLLSRRYDRPIQRPHTRVEPLGIQKLEVVSARKRNQWRAATPIGVELRSVRVPASPRPFGPDRPLICAIDLGTSYSVAAILDDDQHPHLIPSPEGQRLVPSVVSFTADLDYVVGSPAIDAERHRPQATIRNVKRQLGTGTSYEVEGRSLAPEFAASLVLRSLKANAEEYLQTRVDRCIVSNPANFSIAQSNALLKAYELAGLEVLRMIGEPNVASFLLARSDPEWEGIGLVVDLGGGTFDVAIVWGGEGVLEIVAVAGSNHIGGLDYDEALAAHVESELRDRLGSEVTLTPTVKRQVRREAERAKRALGLQPATSILLQDLELDDGGLRDIEIPVDRDLFRALTEKLDLQVEKTIEKVFGDMRATYGKDADEIDYVLLAGQGSKIFTVQERLQRFGLTAPVISQYQETAVVHGLAYQIGMLFRQTNDPLLLNVAHRGVGIRCHPDPKTPAMTVSRNERENLATGTLVARSTTIPTRRSEMVMIDGEEDRPVTFQVLELADDPEGGAPIGTIRTEIPAGTSEVEFTVDIDANTTMLLKITDHQHRMMWEYQLNNLFRSVGSQPEDVIERILEGFTVWPVQKLSDGEVTAGAVAGISLQTMDVDAELRRLDERIRLLEQGRWAPADIINASGRELEAILVRTIERCRAVRDRLTELPRTGQPA